MKTSHRFAAIAAMAIVLANVQQVRAQYVVNPSTLVEHMNILLEHTDVYYDPFAPPSSHDTREYVSSRGDIYRDPNGRGSYWFDYLPQVYDASGDSLVDLWKWAPHGTPIGGKATWQRLFYAGFKPTDGSPSDIVASDSVVVSPLEDVDFRATGTVKLERGFHVKPGAFFHAYQEPRWDTTVFSDEFDDTATFRNQWYVYWANGSDFRMPQCEFDSNVALVADPAAHDGHAVDLMMRVSQAAPFTSLQIQEKDFCGADTVIESGHPKIDTNIVSTGYIRSCPFPLKSNASSTVDWAYPHAPYGKYEIRDKVPLVPHHSNNWGGGVENMEWDIGETIGSVMSKRSAGFGHTLMFGPYRGHFTIRGAPNSDTLFIIEDDPQNLDYDPQGKILCINVGTFNFGVDDSGFVKDTVRAAAGLPFPSSFVTSGELYTCYYGRDYEMSSDDSIRWNIYSISGKTVFAAPFHVRSGDSIYFRKEYQPASVYILDSLTPAGDTIARWHRCHWEYSVNSPDKGLLELDDLSLHPVSLVANVEQYRYQLPDIFSTFGSGFGYRMPPYDGGPDALGPDSNAYKSQPYVYHTFAMEYLPHEVRYLYDGVVVRRYPDRLIPPSSEYFDWIGRLARGGINIIPGEFNGDSPALASYILSHLTNSGVWDVTVGGHTYHAAHHLLDYVKVYDVPSNVVIPHFPQ